MGDSYVIAIHDASGQPQSMVVMPLEFELTKSAESLRLSNGSTINVMTLKEWRERNEE